MSRYAEWGMCVPVNGARKGVGRGYGGVQEDRDCVSTLIVQVGLQDLIEGVVLFRKHRFVVGDSTEETYP